MSQTEIFNAAAKLTPDERAAFLDRACGGDRRLRDEVESLLQAHDAPVSFLREPVDRTGAYEPPVEHPGMAIGPYKLVEAIGEGGMGTVWMAQQQEPVKRVVALKLIKSGMDSKQVIARFEAERQALALMDHANIARVLEAGTTSAGRPYFVMELVKGVPITKYCDVHHLTPRQRLELFIPVCQAIQHAHQKGIIHRDIKPNNVLVALYDGKPVPKVIDFGVAKATGQPLTDRTLLTGFGAVVGTPEYMSPEQAELNQLDIDTRSDIYSLGVLLYELLAGSPPFTKQDLEKAGVLEMLRVIREQEPSKPSTKLSTAEGLPTLAANRGTEPAKLTRMVRGELDWIVMKALEKDRSRRYETANAFAIDVQRYLANETVQACPPSAGYRLRKFARRNKRSLAVATTLALALLVGIGGIGWAVRDRAAKQREADLERINRQNRLTAQVAPMLEEVEQMQRVKKWPEALVLARAAEVALAGGEPDEETKRRVHDLVRDLEFVAQLEQNRLDSIGVGGSRNESWRRAADKYSQAIRDYGVDLEHLSIEKAVARLKERPALASPVAVSLEDWAGARRVAFGSQDQFAEKLVGIARQVDSDALRRRVYECLDRAPTPEARAVELRRLSASIDARNESAEALTLLSKNLAWTGATDVAVTILRDARLAYPGDFWLNVELGRLLHSKGDPEAGRYYTAAVSIRPSSVGAYRLLALWLPTPADQAAVYRRMIALNTSIANGHYGLGVALSKMNQLDEALASFRRATEVDPDDWLAYYGLSGALRAKKRYGDAAAAAKKAIALSSNDAGGHFILGAVLCDQGETDKGIASLQKAIDLDKRYYLAYSMLGNALESKGLLDDAVLARREGVRIYPQLTELWHLGAACGAAGHWDEAAAAFAQAVRLKPDDGHSRNLLAVAHLGAGNVEGYRRACRGMLDRFADTDKPEPAERTVCACLLVPGWLDAGELDRVQNLAQQAVTGTEKDSNFRFFARAKAMADLRAGRFQDAVGWVKRYAPKGTDRHHDVIAFAILAMAQTRLGRDEEARSSLKRAREILSKQPDPKKDRPFVAAQSHGWLYSRILFREAEALLKAGDK